MSEAQNGAATDGPINELTSHVAVVFHRGDTTRVQVIPNLTDPVQVLTATRFLLDGPGHPAMPCPTLRMTEDRPYTGQPGEAAYAVLRFERQGSPSGVLHLGALNPALIRAALELMQQEAQYDLSLMIHQMRTERAQAAPKIWMPTGEVRAT